MKKIFLWGLLGSISILSLNSLFSAPLSGHLVLNDPPIAVNDTTTTNQGLADTIDVLANDIDPEGGVLHTRYVAFLGPQNGTARVINQNEIIYTPNSGYIGVDSFQYFSCDASSECSVAWIFITIEDIPEPPIIDDSVLSAVETDEDTALDILIGENVTDPEDDVLVITIIDDVVHGTTTLFGDTINYIPDVNYNGLDSLRFIVCDPTPLCDTLWTIITVHPVNDDPVTAKDQITLNEDTLNAVILPLINDSDIDGDMLTVGSVISISTTATITISDDTTIIYSPPVDYFGVDTLLYEACDLETCIIDTIIVTVLPINDPPIANDDVAMVDEDSTILIPILSNDIDVDDDNLTITINTNAVNGTASLINDSLQYIPDLDFNGMDSVQYVLCDAEPLCDTAWVRITVNPINDPPVTASDQITLTEDTTNAVILPLINDSDGDGDMLTVGSIISISTTATITISDDTTIIYSPPADYFGVDTLLYEACDLIICIVDTIIVTVLPINDAPIANDDVAMVDEDSTILIPILSNDIDVDSDNLTITINTNAVNGTATLINDSLQYIPDLDFNGLDSVQYVLCDAEPLCDTAWVRITVNPVNDPPVTTGDQITLTEDTTNAVILPLINDSDGDGDMLTVGSIISISTTATLTITDDTTIIYSPPADYFGVDTLLYEACDLIICIADTIIVTVLPINDAPIANDDVAMVDEDSSILIPILSNDIDVDNDNLTITINTNAVNGTATLINDSLQYIPDLEFNGLDSVQYVLCDAEPLCDTAWVRITVNPVNDPPVTTGDQITLTEDTTNAVILPLINDSDGDGDDLTIGSIISINTTATITITDDTTIVYSPPANFFGVDTLFYEACDLIICTVDTIIVTVSPINDAPGAEDDVAMVDEDNAVLIPILDNDMDIDSDNLTITINTNAVNGTASIINDSLQYNPDLNFNGVDSVQYVLCDAEPLCDTAWVRITVNPINDPPGGFGPPGTPNADGEVIICVVEDTTNVIVWPFAEPDATDGDELTLVSTTSATSGGNVVIQGDTAFIYNPPMDWNGMDTVGILVCDPLGLCVTDTIYIEVKPVADPVIAMDDHTVLFENDTTVVPVFLNDSNPDGGPTTFTILVPPTNGIAALNGDNVEYIPTPEFFGADSLTYQVCNSFGACDIAIVYISIEFKNEKPIAPDDETIFITDTTSINVDIISNSSDPNGDTLIIEILNDRLGDVTIEDDGTITYTPPDGFIISDTIYFAVCDTHAIQLCDTAFIVFEMICPSFNHMLSHDALCPDVEFSVTGTEERPLTQYEWSFADQLGIITTDPTIAALKIQSPKRLVLQSQQYGCAPQLDSISVNVRNFVLQAELAEERIECEFSAVALSVNASNNLLSYDWYYAPTNTLVGNGAEIIIAELNNTTAGDYYVIASDGYCLSERSDSLNLQILTDLTPPVIEAGEDQLICGQEISLNATASPGMPFWSINGNAFIADVNNPQTRIFDPEVGENKFYWIQENISCIEPSIDSVSVFYYPLPAPVRDSFFVELNEDYLFDLKPNDNYHNLNTSIAVLNTPEGVTDHGNGTVTVNIDGSKESPLDFEYEVCFDECPDNCKTTVVNVHFEQPSICVVPDVITPNGDGFNDYLVIDCTYQYPQSSIIIFNRWGDEVYNNNDYDNTWGGTKDGEPLAVGTYFYIFKVNNTEDSVEKGFIHIDR